jgi:pilus assembly protein Flp/PilA
MTKFFNKFIKDESGATAIEYGLIAALMAVAVIAAVALLQPKMEDAFENIGTSLDGPAAAAASSSTPA